MEDAHLCIRCKGKNLCGRPLCPILERFEVGQTIKLGESLFGASPPAVFVGRQGYPDIQAGPLVPPEITGTEAASFDDPMAWATRDVGDILGLRSKLVRSKCRVNIREHENRFIEQSQEIALSTVPVDTEITFSKAPRYDLRFDSVLMPMGPSGDIKNMRLTENPTVPRKVDYLTGDTDVKAVDAVMELYGADVSPYHINRLLSIGLLGVDRKLVPTRWAITATDDMIGRQISDEILSYPEISGVQVFSGERLGNHFEVILAPRSYSYELTEIWLPRSVWGGEEAWVGVDGEDHNGKKKYSHLAGGYYAARLAALEYLKQIRRQAAVYMVREILPSYWAPLGSWVVGEAARAAMQSIPRRFDCIDEALVDIESRIKTPAAHWRLKSQLIDYLQTQRTLESFWGIQS